MTTKAVGLCGALVVLLVACKGKDDGNDDGPSSGGDGGAVVSGGAGGGEAIGGNESGGVETAGDAAGGLGTTGTAGAASGGRVGATGGAGGGARTGGVSGSGTGGFEAGGAETGGEEAGGRGTGGAGTGGAGTGGAGTGGAGTGGGDSGGGIGGGTGGSGGQSTGGGVTGGAPVVLEASCSDAFEEDAECAGQANPAARTFYVSSSTGRDTDDGLSEDTALATVAAVNALELVPGDQVLFRCGDVWRGEQLVITDSGEACQHIVFGSYPRTCEDQPILSGSQPISGWVEQGDHLWEADLGAGANAGRFGQGINQLFQGEQRLPLGRWPNADDASFDHGYSYIDRQPNGTTIEDDELPAGDFAGAVIRVKTIRWLLLNRRVVSSSGSALVLEDALSCWDECGTSDLGHGWGYLITNHPATLDQAGEWYFDRERQRVTLFSSTEPSGVEASVIPMDVEDPDDPGTRGIVVLGENLGAHIRYVVLENLHIENGFRHGITTPINLGTDENSALVIRCNTIRNVDSIGLNLATWVWDAGADSGWRGGADQVIANNVIDGPNHFGIQSYASRTTFQDNVIQNVGLAENLGVSGLGCEFFGDNCTENGDGVHMPVDQAAWNSHSIVFRHNRIERTGYCGLDLFGGNTTVEENAIVEACVTKGDCGAIRTYGRDGFGSTALRNVTLRRNVIDSVLGNTDGAGADFARVFGFGLYIDNYSSDVASEENTIIGTSYYPILYQNSTGVVRDNVAVVRDYAVPVVAILEDSTIEELEGNTLVALVPQVPLVRCDQDRLLASDENIFFNPYDAQCVDGGGTSWTLAEWQDASGMDGASAAAWYNLDVDEPSNVEVFLNDTAEAETVTLAGEYVDLRQVPVESPVELPPYSSVVLVAE
ncbi:MAG: right-handed parallel beta-helix repeat-containing protein [Polyangiaceae bacterium]|nr:right-handed parallel beta-helix repeat-containing protein [Polyangiaceae bacterium]